MAMQLGTSESLDMLQMSLRAAACFVVALVLVRIAGRRAFGMRTPFDNVTGPGACPPTSTRHATVPSSTDNATRSAVRPFRRQ